MSTLGDTLRKRWSLIAYIVLLVLVLWLVFALRSVLLPFIIGFILAYLLLPPISWVENRLPSKLRGRSWVRSVLIILFFLLLIGLLGFLIFTLVNIIIQAVADFIQSSPQFMEQAIARLQELTRTLRERVPEQFRQQVDSFINNSGQLLLAALQRGLAASVPVISGAVGFFLGFATLPLFMFYLLKDWDRLRNGFYHYLPDWASGHARATVTILDTVLGRYLRAQLTLGLAVGLLVLIGLLVLRIQAAFALALIAGFTELIPFIGPWLGGAVGVIVTLATQPDKVLWVIVVYLLVQLIENNLLAARIHGGYLRVNPAIALMAIVVGLHLAGIWGMVLAVPFLALLAAFYEYIMRVLRTEP